MERLGREEALVQSFGQLILRFNRINKGRKRNFVDEHLIRLKMPGFLGNMFILLFLYLFFVRFARGTEATYRLEKLNKLLH